MRTLVPFAALTAVLIAAGEPSARQPAHALVEAIRSSYGSLSPVLSNGDKWPEDRNGTALRTLHVSPAPLPPGDHAT